VRSLHPQGAPKGSGDWMDGAPGAGLTSRGIDLFLVLLCALESSCQTLIGEAYLGV